VLCANNIFFMLTFNLPLSCYIQLQYFRAQTKIALQHYINLYKIVLDYYTNVHLSTTTLSYVYYSSCLFHCSLLGSSSKVIRHLIVPYIPIAISLKTLITHFFLQVHLWGTVTKIRVCFPLSQISLLHTPYYFTRGRTSLTTNLCLHIHLLNCVYY
jgi:hypothetical protein